MKVAEAESSKRPIDATPHAEDSYTHFSTFALSGANGTVRWHHLPGDFQAKKNEVIDQSLIMSNSMKIVCTVSADNCMNFELH